MVAARVARARAVQLARGGPEGAAPLLNSRLEGDRLELVAAPDAEGRALLDRAAETLKLTARGYHRVMRIARTIADLDGDARVARNHIAEAASYRRAPLRR